MSAISVACDIIRKWEGLRLTAYQDQVGIWTVGYGSTGKNITRGTKITEDQADEMLRQRVLEDYNWLKKWVTLNDNQFGACLSLMYNIGRANFKSSSLFTHLKNRNYEEVGRQFLRWKYITINGVKKVSDGLYNRRVDEKNLFLKPI